jgi:hypothetical protein
LANDTQVTRLTDSNATDEQAYFDAVEGSLRQALINAEDFEGDNTITFAAPQAVDNTINLVAALPNINSDLIIDGPGASRLTIQRSGEEAFNIFTINGGEVQIEGLTLANGFAEGTIADAENATQGSRGGAIDISSTSSVVLINNSVIQGSEANNGGAIANLSRSLTINNSTITGNTGSNGGGILNLGGTIRITNSTIANNQANVGGGIFNFGGLTLTNSTIANNIADSSAGGLTNLDTANLKNTLVAANTAPNSPDISAPAIFPINSGGNNLIGDGTGVDGLTATDIVGVAPDALLIEELANNGGLTPTIALLPLSPAIDAGNAEFSGVFTVPGDFDQRGDGFPDGFPRIVNNVIDIGAFEFQG